MARGVNKVILVGNLGEDPDVRYMPNGKPVEKISLATSDSYKDKNTGQMVDKTEWHRVIFFGKLAEVVGEYCRKGSQIYVEGKLQTRKWTDQQSIERYTTEIVVDGFTGQMQMLGQRQQSNQSTQGNNSYQNSNSSYQGNNQGQNKQQQSGHAQNNQKQGGFAPKQNQGVTNNQYMNGGQQGGASNPMGPGDDFYDDDIPF